MEYNLDKFKTSIANKIKIKVKVKLWLEAESKESNSSKQMHNNNKIQLDNCNMQMFKGSCSKMQIGKFLIYSR